MKLRDSFLNRPAPPPARAALGVLKEALAGVGDRDVRVAQDFLWSMGVAPMPGGGVQGWVPAEGDSVEFPVPGGDGIRRAGVLYQLQGKDAIVQVDAGEYNIVPIDRLAPRSTERRRAERRAQIQAVMAGREGPHLHETRALIPLGTGSDYALTLEYKAGLRPTAEDVEAYVAMRYSGARIVDGDDTYPGRFGLVVSFSDPELGRRALAASRKVFGQLEGPAEPPSSRENATGIGTEEIEGTGKIGAPGAEAEGEGTMGQGGDDLQPLGGQSIITTEKKRALLAASAEAFQRLAAQYPFSDITETSIEETSVGFISHFAMTDNGRRLFVREGMLTPILAEGAAPAIGTVAVSDAGVAVHLAHVLIADYDAGQGPLSMHENEPGANESGSYVVKADEVQADFEQEGKIPYQMMDYRREKERYDADQEALRKQEERSKQRRLEQLKLKSPQPGQQPGQKIHTGEHNAPATEEDGEVREHIGGPGLHIAVDDTAEDYYEDYFGPYGKQLTKDVAIHVGELIRTAWKDAGRDEPTAEEFLWAASILMAPLTWDASHRVADQFDELAKKLMQSANVSGAAKQKLLEMMSQQLAKGDPMLAKRFRAGDPAVMQKFLPNILRNMPPDQVEKLTYQFAPQEASGYQPGWLQRNVLNRGREKQRQQIEHGLEMEQWMGGGGAGAGAGAPAQSGAAGAGAAAPQRAPGAGGAQKYTVPAGTQVKDPNGATVTLPSDMSALMQRVRTPQSPSVPAGATPPAPEPTAAPQPSPTAAPPPPATAGEAAGMQPRAQVEIPKGAEAYDLDGKRIRVAAPLQGTVLKQEGGVTLVRTSQGQVLRLGRPRAEASRRRQADAATDAYAGRRPPALNQLRFRMDGLVRKGDYLVASIVWDADAAKAMGPANLVANLKAYVKQRAGEKEFIDLGFIGRPVIDHIDLPMGIADVRFRSSESRVGPQEVITREEAPYRELA